VFDGEANAWPRMKDVRWGQELCRESSHSVPSSVIPLTAPRKRAPPEINHIVPEGSDASTVSRYRVICEVSADDLSQPSTLKRDWFVHAPPQLFFDDSQPCSHPVPACLPFKLENTPGETGCRCE
jgi:hypothetical protein